jgi:hypothetical protein
MGSFIERTRSRFLMQLYSNLLFCRRWCFSHTIHMCWCCCNSSSSKQDSDSEIISSQKVHTEWRFSSTLKTVNDSQKITCKSLLAKWNMQNTLSSDQASMAQLTSLSDLNATRATGSSTLLPGFLLSLNSQSVFTDLIFNWNLHDCVVVQMMRFISVLGGSQNWGENWHHSQAFVLTMKNGWVSPIGDIWIDMCPLYEVNPDWKLSLKKTWKNLKIVS